MLGMVTGGVGCGKSAYAERWAASLGREAILLSCPAWPYENSKASEANGLPSGRPWGSEVTWLEWDADESLSDRLDQINLRSNPFRADHRVIVLDSLSGWLRKAVLEARREVYAAPAEEPPRRGRRKRLPETEEVFALRTGKVERDFQAVVDALLRFHGKRIVVTEQPVLGLADDPWERWYARELAAANLRLAERCNEMRMIVSGTAMEMKGARTKRGNHNDENLYPNWR